jgi:hypothetical protein
MMTKFTILLFIPYSNSLLLSGGVCDIHLHNSARYGGGFTVVVLR